MQRNEFHKKTRAEIEQMNSKEIDGEIQRLLTFLRELKQTLPQDNMASDDLKVKLAISLSKQITRWIAEGAMAQPKTHGDLQKISALEEVSQKAKSLGDLNFLIETVLNKHDEAVYRARLSSKPIEDLSSRLEGVKLQLLSVISSPNATDAQVEKAQDLNDLVNTWRGRLQEMKKNLKDLPYDEAAKTKEIRAAIRVITKEIGMKLKEPDLAQQMTAKLMTDLQGASNVIKKKVVRKKKKTPASAKKADSPTPKQPFGGLSHFAVPVTPKPSVEQPAKRSNAAKKKF